MQAALIGVLAVLAMGCGQGGSADTQALEQTLGASVRGTGLTWDPLEGPDGVLIEADLVVVGELVGISDGVRIAEEPDGRGARYLAYEIRVTEVLKNGVRPVAVGEVVDVEVLAAGETDSGTVDLLRPSGVTRVAVALDEVDASTFGEDGLFMFDGTGAKIETALFPFPDVFWFEADVGLAVSPYLDGLEELKLWSGLSDLDSLIDSVRDAKS